MIRGTPDGGFCKNMRQILSLTRKKTRRKYKRRSLRKTGRSVRKGVRKVIVSLHTQSTIIERSFVQNLDNCEIFKFYWTNGWAFAQTAKMVRSPSYIRTIPIVHFVFQIGNEKKADGRWTARDYSQLSMVNVLISSQICMSSWFVALTDLDDLEHRKINRY